METNFLTATVQSGGTGSTSPLVNAPVSLYEATEGGLTLLASGVTDGAGSCPLKVSHTTSDSIFYAVVLRELL